MLPTNFKDIQYIDSCIIKSVNGNKKPLIQVYTLMGSVIYLRPIETPKAFGPCSQWYQFLSWRCA